MHVSPAKHSYAWLPRKCVYRTDAHTQTDRQTDGRTEWSLCAAMPRRRHKKYIKILKKCEHWYHDREKLKDGKLSTYFNLSLTVVLNHISRIKRILTIDVQSLVSINPLINWKFESDRYNNTPRELCFCNKCNEKLIEDEMHIFITSENNSSTTKLWFTTWKYGSIF